MYEASTGPGNGGCPTLVGLRFQGIQHDHGAKFGVRTWSALGCGISFPNVFGLPAVDGHSLNSQA